MELERLLKIEEIKLRRRRETIELERLRYQQKFYEDVKDNYSDFENIDISQAMADLEMQNEEIEQKLNSDIEDRINDSERQLDFFRRWRQNRRLNQLKMQEMEESASQDYLDNNK